MSSPSPKRRCKVCRTPYASERFCPLDGGAIVDDDTTDDAMVGRTIDGRYLVRGLLGRGGMGAVYEADHIGLDKRVAIKFLAHDDDKPEAVARFRREARAACKLTHEHVVQIFDVGTTTDGTDFIVMEYVEGTDLRRALDRGPLEPARAVAIARQMLLGLHAIHQAGIIHRDVKPANVLLTTRGANRDFVKLTDFGIAKSMRDAGEQLTETGKVVGTPQFMAPEQFVEQQLDHRADVYSAGLTLFAMLAGDVPFAGRSVARLAAKHLGEQPPSLHELRPGLPAPLVDAIERALEKSPDARFPDALEFAAALDAIAPALLARADTAAAANAPPSAVDGAKPVVEPPAPSEAPTAALRLSRSGADTDVVGTSSQTDDVSTSDSRRTSPEARDNVGLTRRLRPWLIAGVAVLVIGAIVVIARKRRSESMVATPLARDAGASPQQLAAVQLASARAAEGRGDLEFAIVSYQAAYAADPAATEPLYRIADLEERLGRRREAVRYFRRYLEATPAAADRDTILERIGKLDAAPIDAGVRALDAALAKPRTEPPRKSQRCICFHSDRVMGGASLCTKVTTPLCRCKHEGAHVCPSAFRCDPPAATTGPGCPQKSKLVCDADPQLGTFHVRAKPGQACSGYVDRTESVTGSYECTVCPEIDPFTYRGMEGDPCTGFVRTTGEPARGVMTNCEDRD